MKYIKILIVLMAVGTPLLFLTHCCHHKKSTDKNLKQDNKNIVIDQTFDFEIETES